MSNNELLCKIESLQRRQGGVEDELRAARDTISKLQFEITNYARELKKKENSASVDENRSDALRRDLEDARLAARSTQVHDLINNLACRLLDS